MTSWFWSGIHQLLGGQTIGIIDVDQFKNFLCRGHELGDELLVLRSTQRGSTLLVGAEAAELHESAASTASSHSCVEISIRVRI